MNSQLKNYLDNNRILRSAEPQNIDRYLTDESVSERAFETGDIILSPDRPKKYVGIMLSGAASVSPVADSAGTVLKVICAGDMFGIANLYSENECFPSVITAKKRCRVLLIDGEAFKRLIENDGGALREYLTILSNKIVYLNKKISTFTAGSTEKKLCVFLAENECGGVFSQSISMSSLADMLSVGRASLYRALDALTDEGLIVRDGKTILIPDKNALLQFNK